jgi:nicotinamide mononucleotide (NMN) deamidase PncC
MVCISASYRNQDNLTKTFFFSGDREAVRLQTVLASIELMLGLIEKN